MANEFSYTEIASSTAQLRGLDVPTVYELYHLRSSLDEKHLVELSSSIQRAVSQPAIIDSFGKTINAENLSSVPLSDILDTHSQQIMDIWSKRISTRTFSSKAVELEELSVILKALLGSSPTLQHRSYASAGACFPNEVFVNVRNVKGVISGFYYLDLTSLSLRLVKQGKFRLTLEDHEQYASLSIVIISLFNKVTYKYGERGYRFSLLEAGAMTQIIETTTNLIGLGSVSSGGFRDDTILKLAELYPPQAGVMAVVHIGKKA
ncbi:SagB/ThcOx family dehydrogenase [Gardnerella vaginalis]|uniref:SagB/ThcOx family dehydrogenase n=1 Tax=Gardnerella vaginalis TaxID=2702 RepID=UPI00066125EF|nr:SagB/ThcOx family dehydrogenase [Gardnerella vaginalis]